MVEEDGVALRWRSVFNYSAEEGRVTRRAPIGMNVEELDSVRIVLEAAAVIAEMAVDANTTGMAAVPTITLTLPCARWRPACVSKEPLSLFLIILTKANVVS
jgi:hypothetical protein